MAKSTKKDADFQEHYDDLVDQYGDPLEVLFDMANDTLMVETVRMAAAKECVSYRYAKLKAIEVRKIVEERKAMSTDQYKKARTKMLKEDDC